MRTRPRQPVDRTAAVVDALRRAAAVVVPLVREVPPAVLKRRPAPDRWSVHEHACHLAHVHALFFDRRDCMFRQLALHDVLHAYWIEELLLRSDWPADAAGN